MQVSEWRKGTEKDLDNVLQIHSVYSNASKGDLEACFGTSDTSKILLMILEKGEVQVGEKERQQALENLNKDIANNIAEKTINPETKRPYTATMIEKVLSDVHFNPNPNKNAKQLALDAIKWGCDTNDRLIQASGIIPIARVRIRLRVAMPISLGKRCKDQLVGLCTSIEGESWDDEFELTALVEPGNFKTLTELVSRETKGKGVVELLTTQPIDD
ncbi:hypothetical protein HDU91_000354 [Kappamyces sp. JEL0680]|nr:hypothetical protein HDU91_000354 [Kappamyces sp. JEL0680]